jgi:hypothetical protein
MSLRDRLHRTDDPEVKRRLEDELRAVLGEGEAGPAPGRGVTDGDG